MTSQTHLIKNPTVLYRRESYYYYIIHAISFFFTINKLLHALCQRIITHNNSENLSFHVLYFSSSFPNLYFKLLLKKFTFKIKHPGTLTLDHTRSLL
jgi:hypothetical protein